MTSLFDSAFASLVERGAVKLSLTPLESAFGIFHRFQLLICILRQCFVNVGPPPGTAVLAASKNISFLSALGELSILGGMAAFQEALALADKTRAEIDLKASDPKHLEGNEQVSGQRQAARILSRLTRTFSSSRRNFRRTLT
jgi:hypothetical protein